MAYVTAAGTTTTAAQAFIGDEAPVEARADVLLRRAERAVKSVSVAPDPVTAEYTQTAGDAELEITEFLVLRPDRVKSQELGDLGLTYFDKAASEDEYGLARRLMSDYLPVEVVGTDANVGTITTISFS